MRRLLLSMGLASLLIALATEGFSQQPVPPAPAPPVVFSGSTFQITTIDEKGAPTPGGAQPSFRIMTSPNNDGNGNPNGRGNGNGKSFGGAPGPVSTILGGLMMQGMGGQGGGGPGGGGGGRMGGMMGGDPNQMFNMFSKGKEVINRNDLPPPLQPMFDRFAPQMGITNGQISRQQFLQASEQMRSRMQQMGGGGGPGSMSPEQFDRFAEGRFRRADQNNDGLLSANEMPENLRSVWEKFDLNKDGAIDLNEFKGFMRSQFQQDQSPKPVDPQQPVQVQLPLPDSGSASDEDDRRPTVYRAGKLPKDIPAWFDQLDTDRDGQIGLYEWVNGNRSVDEFRQIDRNEDGFITIDEVMIYVRGNVANGSQGDMYVSNNQNGFNGFGNGMMMQFGDNGNQDNRGRPGRGRGGDNGGGRGPGGGGPMMRGGDNGGGRGPGGPGRRGGDFNGGGNNNGNGFFGGNGFIGGMGGGNNGNGGNGFNGGGPGRGGDNSGFQGRGRGGDKSGGGPGRGRGGDNANSYGPPPSDNGKTVPPRNNQSNQGYGGE